jgi:hypothetical protein
MLFIIISFRYERGVGDALVAGGRKSSHDGIYNF